MRSYANALEEWDDMVGDNWDEPDSEYLNPITWINEDEWFTHQKPYLEEVLVSGYAKANEFIKQFHNVLSIYWRNRQFSCDILVHERLKNPTDALNYAIMYFEYQEDLFNNTIPKSTNLGLLELDSTVTRDFLTPVPKQMIKDIEKVVPVVIRERVDEAKDWL